MENQGNNEKAPAEPQAPTPGVVPPRRPSGNGKWIAVIVVLIVVIAALVVLTQYHPGGSSAKVVSAANVATLNEPYNLTLQSNGVFKSVTVNWGDSHSNIYDYQGSNQITLRHTYSSPGDYFVTYSFNYGGSTFNNYQSLIPVHITAPGVNPTVAYGLMQLENSSSNPLVNDTMIYNPGVNLGFIAGYFSQPTDGVHTVVGQTLNVYQNGSLVTQTVLPYYYSASAGQYQLSASDSVVNLTNLSGNYILGLQTTSAVPMTTTNVATTVTNTTMASYAAGQKVTYGNATNLTYGTTVNNYTTVPPVLSYLVNTNVTTAAGTNTNITYTSANVTYNEVSTNLSLPLSKTVMVAAGANFTVNGGNATVAFLTNGSYMNSTLAGGVSQNFNNTTTSYNLVINHSYKFAQATELQVLSTAKNTTFLMQKDSNVVYGPKAKVTMWGASSLTYNTNSILSYTNSATSVTYLQKTNVTITMEIPGVSAPLSIGEIDPSQGVYTSTYYYDVVAMKNANQYVAPTKGQSFTSAEVAAGGYTTLDPQINFFTVDAEILGNTMMPLIYYNGSSSSSFVPMLASQVPSVANGGINSAFTNYTFHVKSGFKWQDGSSVTVYDAYIGLVRLLLFSNGNPGTGGYLLGDYLIPQLASGGFNTSYSAITHAITYDNNTNNVTLHFMQPVPTSVVFQLIAQSEASPVDYNWLVAHGDGIQFTPSGFANYSNTGNLADYNTYVQNHIMADGPYMVSYNLPGSQIVLTKNPNFVSPGKWFPAASITTVTLQYFSQPSTAFLELKSGAAQSATGIPATPYWPQIEGLAGIHNVGTGPYITSPPTLQIKEFPTLAIYFFNFNLNTNTQELGTIVHNANVPANFFMNLNVRKAFSYAFNYSKYLNDQLGNALYNTTFDASYVGMLPPGMLFNQSISQLKALGYSFHNENGSAFSNLIMAKYYWGKFMNSSASVADGASAMGISNNGHGIVDYKGSPLVIPIFLPTGDNPDTAAATTWGNAMAQVIGGASFPVVPSTYTQLFATYLIPGQNPMPISWGGWSPDFIFPTDYQNSMSMPSNTSTYMGAASYNPWFLLGGNSTSSSPLHNFAPNTTEYHFAEQMIAAYNNGTSATTLAGQKMWFQKVNGFIVNQTMNVYLYQANQFWTISSKINGNDIVNNQENLLVGAGQELIYNLLSYNSTAS